MQAVVNALVVLFTLLMPMSSQAVSQALLIGIGQYPGAAKLEGPINDVGLVKELLLHSEYFNNENIVELLDEKATKKNIIDAIHQIQSLAVSGDKVVLYFSGHGTSALNDQIDADVPSNSGALVPYDIEGLSGKDELKDRLLVGRRDLRPVLNNLDKAGVEVLVLVDACFSGNVVRGYNGAETLPSKFLEFSNLLPELFRRKELAAEPAALIKTQQYPYRNVYLIAAAQEDQYAHDIPSDRLTQFPTIDLKPHGAFTDSLVRALAGLYRDAIEGSANITLSALHLATRRLMIDRGFLSTPSLLPIDHSLTSTIDIKGFFGEPVSIRHP